MRERAGGSPLPAPTCTLCMLHLTLIAVIHSSTQRILNDHLLCARHCVGRSKKIVHRSHFSRSVFTLQHSRVSKQEGEGPPSHHSGGHRSGDVRQRCGNELGFLQPGCLDWTPALPCHVSVATGHLCDLSELSCPIYKIESPKKFVVRPK